MTEPQNERTPTGTFAAGNKCGKGRPRRKIEVEFLAAIGEGVSLPTWRKIIKQAVTDALAGNAAARAWLSRHLCGASCTLEELAVGELNGTTVDAELEAQAREARELNVQRE